MRALDPDKKAARLARVEPAAAVTPKKKTGSDVRNLDPGQRDALARHSRETGSDVRRVRGATPDVDLPEPRRAAKGGRLSFLNDPGGGGGAQPGEDRYGQSLETLDEHFEVYDTAGGNDPDGKVSHDDLETVADPENEEAVRQRLAEEGVPAAELDEVYEEVQQAAAFLTDEESEPYLHALDTARGRGGTDGRITREDVTAARELAASLPAPGSRDVNTTSDAIDVLHDYRVIADTAGGGGGQDEHISQGDLETLAGSENLPPEVRAAAQLLLDTHEADPDRLSALHPLDGDLSLSFDALEGLHALPAETREVALEHTPRVDVNHSIYPPIVSVRYTEIEDGRVVWADSGEPLTADEYRALSDGAAVDDQVAETLFRQDVEEIRSHVEDRFDDAAGELDDAYGPVAEENQFYGQFLEEYGPFMTPDQLEQAEAEHQGRLEDLQADLEAEAGDFVDMAEDPLFAEVFSDLDEEKQGEFYERVSEQLTVTQAGSAFADDLADAYEQASENPDEESDNPYVRGFDRLVSGGKDVTRIRNGVTALALTRLLGAPDSAGVETFAQLGRYMYGGNFPAVVEEGFEQLAALAEAGTPAEFEAARQRLASTVSRAQKAGISVHVSRFLAAGALTVDLYTMHQNGWSNVLDDPELLLNTAKDSAETLSFVSLALRNGASRAATAARLGTASTFLGRAVPILGAVASLVGFAQAVEEGDVVSAVGNGLTAIGLGITAVSGGTAAVVGAVLVGIGTVLTVLPGLFSESVEDRYNGFVNDRFEQLFDEDSFLYQQLPMLNSEQRQDVLRAAEEYDLPPEAILAVALRGAGIANPYSMGNIGDGINEIDGLLTNPLWTTYATAAQALYQLSSLHGVDQEEAVEALEDLTSQAYLEYVRENPADAVSYGVYVEMNWDDIQEQLEERFT